MQAYLIFVLLLFRPFIIYSTQQEPEDFNQFEMVLSAECEPLTTIGGCVNVASGRFFQTQEDLVDNTIDPIRLMRYYDSSHSIESCFGVGFGSQFALFATPAKDKKEHSYAYISEREGFLIPYKGSWQRLKHSYHKEHTCQIDPKLLQRGYTNLNRFAGQTHFRNWQAVFSSENKGWVVTKGDGCARTYDEHLHLSRVDRLLMGFPTEDVYLLKEETKPNGNILCFTYDVSRHRPRLQMIQTLNRTRQKVLNSLIIDDQDTSCIISSSCSKKLIYTKKSEEFYLDEYVKHKKSVLQAVQLAHQGLISYETERSSIHDIPRITRIKKPHDQWLAIAYNKQGQVESLAIPLKNQKDQWVKAYSFTYHTRQTEVRDALNHLTTYHFDDHQRLNYVDEWEKGLSVRRKCYEWSTLAGEEGNLRAKALCEGFFCWHRTTYRYDERGNIKTKTFYGNLTGERSNTFLYELRETQHVKDHTDHYRVQYEYNERNLLIKKTTPEDLSVSYVYWPGTYLCHKELTSYLGQIQERLFRAYDDNGELCLQIEDDGSSDNPDCLDHVTWRRVKIIEAYATEGTVYFGKPKIMKEYYLSQAGLVPVRQTEFTYDETHGLEAKRCVYKIVEGAPVFYYETTKTYDAYQRLASETDALGQETLYKWDNNGYQIREELVGSGKYTEFEYDKAGRCIQKREIHSNQQTFTTTYHYNALHQLVKETDPYGHDTHYHYDRLGRQTRCIKPGIWQGETLVQPTIKKKYNVLGQVIEETDENDHTTTFAYNSYGSPMRITYPDHSFEKRTYYPSSWLHTQVWDDGTQIVYTYDPKGHLLQEVMTDKVGHTLRQDIYTYKGPLLQTKTDLLGVVTTYRYDGASRKIEERVKGEDAIKLTRYTYDEFDRIIQICRVLDENKQTGQAEHYTYDHLGRKLSKTLTNPEGTVYAKETYQYDRLGQLIERKVWQDENQTAVYRTSFNSYGLREWKQDPLGFTHHFGYNHHHLNAKQQCVLCRTVVDPLQRITLEEENPLHQVVKKERFFDGQLIASTESSYDKKGQLIRQVAYVKEAGQPSWDYRVKWTYNARGWRETEEREGKTTTYMYDTRGYLKSKHKPNGVTLDYTYDALGRLKRLQSSDNTVHYTYTYDAHGNPRVIEDHVQHVKQERTYDKLDRLTSETLHSGVALSYAYDALDRLIQVTLPDSSWIKYTYDTFHLKQIERYSSQGHLLYTCDCLKYNQRGQIIEEQSPASLVQTTYDLNGRCTSLSSPHFTLKAKKFDAIGNLLNLTQKDPSGLQQMSFTYDAFDHLASENQTPHYVYDSLGNCLQKDQHRRLHNLSNQVEQDNESHYTYDLNGNLKTQSNPSTVYNYDALDRLIRIEIEGYTTHLTYDAFNRCLSIQDEKGIKQLLYQKDQEIGSLTNQQIEELRILHPTLGAEKVFAIELKAQPFFPLQDFRANLCALQKADGSLAEWTRYSAFGEKKIYHAEDFALTLPWHFTSKREIEGLVLFTHRLYHSQLMRWLTPDPAGFADGLNLYAYVHNNPFYYQDKDGQMAQVLPIVVTLVEFSWGPTLAAAPVLLPAIGCTIGTALIAYGVYELAVYAQGKFNDNPDEDIERVSDQNKKTPLVEPKKKPYREANFPGTDKDLEQRSDWKDVTHPNQREAGHREFENTQTGEKIRFDKGDPNEAGHEAHDHYHRYNPKSTGRQDRYLDKEGNPVPKGADKSHLYPPEGTTWDFQ